MLPIKTFWGELVAFYNINSYNCIDFSRIPREHEIVIESEIKMNFRRVNENTVRCIVSEEDMKAYGLELDDFFTDKEKAHKFLEKLVELARDEVGYSAKDGMITMQIMPLPKNNLAITFSENRESNYKTMLEQIRDVTNMLEDISGENLMNDSENKSQVYEKFLENLYKDELEGKSHTVESQTKRKSQRKNKYVRVFQFQTLGNVEEFCCSISCGKVITSKLYKEEHRNEFYLVLHKGRLSLVEYNKLCEVALEFADSMIESEIKESYLEEHCTCLIKKKAVNILSYQ